MYNNWGGFAKPRMYLKKTITLDHGPAVAPLDDLNTFPDPTVNRE